MTQCALHDRTDTDIKTLFNLVDCRITGKTFWAAITIIVVVLGAITTMQWSIKDSITDIKINQAVMVTQMTMLSKDMEKGQK